MSEEVSTETVEAPEASTVSNESGESPVDTAAEAAGAEEVETESGPRMFRVKLDGEEHDVTEEELLKGYSRGKVSTRRFEEAAKIRKQTEQLLTALRDPESLPELLGHLGVDFNALVEGRIRQLVEEESVPAEEREKRALAREREKLERERDEWTRKRDSETFKESTARERSRLAAEFKDAAEKTGIPHTPRTIAMMAQVMEGALESGVEMTSEEAAELVREDLETTLQERLRVLDADRLAELLGEDKLSTLRKRDVAHLRAKTDVAKAAEQKKPTPKPVVTTKKRVTTVDEFREFLRSK
jgi:hypothetical protein